MFDIGLISYYSISTELREFEKGEPKSYVYSVQFCFSNNRQMQNWLQSFARLP